MITPNTPLDQLFPHKWMKPKDLTDAGKTTITGRLTKVTIEEVKPQPSQPKEQRLALWLAGHKPYLVTSRTDTETLARYGATTPADLVGKTIAIKLDTFRDQVVLRIAPPPPATAPAPKPNRPAPIPQPPATAPAPVATSAPNPAPAPPPPAAPVAPVAPVATVATASRAGDVEIWPPREPWVARKAKTGEVDWVSTFWAGSAALRIARDNARFILEHNGGSFEDAARDMWEQHLGKDRCDPAADPCPHGFASSCPEGCN